MDLDSNIFHKVFIPPIFQKYLKEFLKKDIYYRLEYHTHGLAKNTKFAGLVLMKKNYVNARSRKTGYLYIIDNHRNIIGNMYIENTPYSKNINYTCLKVK